MKLLTKEQQESCENATIFYICKDYFEKQFTCLGENRIEVKKQKKKLKELINTENKLQKIYPTYYNLLTVENLCQVLYQILLIMYLKEFIELTLI